MSDIAVAKQNFSFVATTPAQMELAQHNMTIWCDQRIETEKLEIAELERTIAEVQNAGLKDGAWKRRLALSRAKIMFYRKVKGALLQGYYIVPPFPVQLFAIRTNQRWPRSGYTTTYAHGSDFTQKARKLEEGKGEWQNPFPIKKVFDEYSMKDGKEVVKKRWSPGEWDSLDFPFKMVKPEVIAAVGKALQKKLFDALGVLPQYRSPDPIVVGQLFPPHRPNDPLTFFVAWWMDPKDL